MAFFALEAVLNGISLGSFSAGKVVFWQNIALFIRSFLPGVWLCFSLTYSRGNHLEFLSRWRSFLLAAFLLPLPVLISLRFETIHVLPYLDPYPGWWLSFRGAAKALNGVFLIATVLVFMNLEKTFRSAAGTTRWRIKFLVLGLGVIFGARFYTQSQALIFSGHPLSLIDIETVALLIGCLLITTAYFRSGFSEIDVYPSRAILHTSVTVVLAGVYLFVVGVLAQIVARFGGVAGFPFAAFLILLGVVVLAVLLLSDRIRQSIQLFVSRHFKRPRYDFRQVWNRFTRSISSVLDEAELCGAASRLISETCHALSVSIWLFNKERDRLMQASSTSDVERLQADEPAREVAFKEANSIDLNKLARPFDLENAKEKWTDTLKGISLARFRTGGNRICVPLLAGEHWLGVIILADRVSGLRYTAEEMDLLRSIGDQVGASLLNLRLTKEIMVAKELEAFQTISAFFIHDLKNTASTLSLMLQNLPLHFNDPSFREDAVRGIRTTVDRINQLIQRASAFRHELQLNLAEVDLNAVVNETLKDLNADFKGEVVIKLNPLPKIVADREQIHSVVTNLLLNARDAIGVNGRITVETKRIDGSVSLSIADNGCGMKAAFVKDSLFRPFRTTKKKGLGIGMFHTKMIVKAHRGDIQVKSQLGSGTIFEIILPVNLQAT